MNKDYKKIRFHERAMGGIAYFDCRMFQMPNDAEMFSYLHWRSAIDCRRNHVSELARKCYSHNQLQGVNVNDMIKMLATKGVVWDDEPACFKRGTFFKKMRREMPEGQENVIRHEFKVVDLKLTKFYEDINNINDILKCHVYPPQVDKSN